MLFTNQVYNLGPNYDGQVCTCCSQIRCIIWVLIMMARYAHAVHKSGV